MQETPLQANNAAIYIKNVDSTPLCY